MSAPSCDALVYCETSRHEGVIARMAKWVDARDLKSLSVKPNAGSSPAPSTVGYNRRLTSRAPINLRLLSPSALTLALNSFDRVCEFGQFAGSAPHLRNCGAFGAVLAVPAVSIVVDQVEDRFRTPALAHLPHVFNCRVRTTVEPRVERLHVVNGCGRPGRPVDVTLRLRRLDSTRYGRCWHVTND